MENVCIVFNVILLADATLILTISCIFDDILEVEAVRFYFHSNENKYFVHLN